MLATVPANPGRCFARSTRQLAPRESYGAGKIDTCWEGLFTNTDLNLNRDVQNLAHSAHAPAAPGVCKRSNRIQE